MTWDAATVQRLRLLWDSGKTAGHIAKILGVTRNAVCGKADRLNLKARPSPIIRPPEGDGCRFPMWGEGRATHAYCGRSRFAGSTYCATHHAQTRIPGSSYTEMERTRRRKAREVA